MMRRLAPLLAVLLAAAGLPRAAQALEACRLPGLRSEVQCGQLVRALDPARPEGPSFVLHYVVVPALARGKRPDPVVLLAGGPGQSAIELAPQLMPLFARLNNRRDIVFVDQRGTGRSAPLDCPEERDAAPLPDMETELARLADCRAHLITLPHVREPAGLGYYTTPLAMQDLDAVRAALGVARWNLVGFSYGTRAALEYQRQFPQALRRSVLDGVAPPDMRLPWSAGPDAQAAFDALLAACAAEPACAQRWPNLAADWATLLASLPRSVTLADPRSGRPLTVMLTRERLLSAVRAPLYAPALAAALPAALAAARDGRYEPLAALAGALAPRRTGRLAAGMHFSVLCSEDLPPAGVAAEAPARDFGRGLAPLYERACADWPRGALPPGYARIASSASPVLLLSGGLDPVTPPRHAERVAAALGPQARHVVAPNAGHGVLTGGCGAELLFRFIDAADDAAALAPELRCVGAMPRPPAYLSPATGAAP